MSKRIIKPYRAEQCAKARLDELDRFEREVEKLRAPFNDRLVEQNEIISTLWNRIYERRKELEAKK